MGQLFWKIVWQFIIILNIELLYGPAIPLLVTYARDMKTHIHTKPMHK